MLISILYSKDELYDWKTKITTKVPDLKMFEMNTNNCFEEKVSEMVGFKLGTSDEVYTDLNLFNDKITSYIENFKNLSVLHIDAHADLRASYLGSKHSHACALYPASKKVKIVQVGIRSISPDEAGRTNTGNVKTFLMHANRDIKKLIPKILKNLTDTVYITIDVDGFDPSVFPGTGTPQPGGLMWYDGLDILREVFKNKNVVAADLVEVSPLKNSVQTEFNAAKLIYRLFGYKSQQRCR
jgi:agmatinase